MCKTLLLLWWIVGGKIGGEAQQTARKGCLRATVATRVWGCELSDFLTLCMVARGLLL